MKKTSQNIRENVRIEDEKIVVINGSKSKVNDHQRSYKSKGSEIKDELKLIKAIYNKEEVSNNPEIQKIVQKKLNSMSKRDRERVLQGKMISGAGDMKLLHKFQLITFILIIIFGICLYYISIGKFTWDFRDLLRPNK